MEPKEYSIDYLKYNFHYLDLKVRPYALFINPDDVPELLPFEPSIPKYVLVVRSNAIEHGKAYLVDRRQLEFENYETNNRPNL